MEDLERYRYQYRIENLRIRNKDLALANARLTGYIMGVTGKSEAEIRAEIYPSRGERHD